MRVGKMGFSQDVSQDVSQDASRIRGHSPKKAHCKETQKMWMRDGYAKKARSQGEANDR